MNSNKVLSFVQLVKITLEHLHFTILLFQHPALLQSNHQRAANSEANKQCFQKFTNFRSVTIVYCACYCAVLLCVYSATGTVTLHSLLCTEILQAKWHNIWRAIVGTSRLNR